MSMRQRASYRPPPESISEGRYLLKEAVGAGGMATVYRVLDTVEQVDRAAKILNEVGSARKKTRQRFLAEAQTMQRLDHPDIVTIYDVGQQDEQFYFVMELAEGGSLHDRLRKRGRLEPRRALRYAYEALSALQHAHDHGVVHRDMKPHNILLSADDHVRLTDFGIARILGDSGLRITATGDMLGTIAYMAPEQRLDPRDVDHTADIYSIGATLYISLTGRRPMDLAMARIDASVMERVPLEARPVIRRAVAQRAEDRYQSARAMAADVAVALAAVDPRLDAERLVATFDLPDIPSEAEPVEAPASPDDSGPGPSFSF